MPEQATDLRKCQCRLVCPPESNSTYYSICKRCSAGMMGQPMPTVIEWMPTDELNRARAALARVRDVRKRMAWCPGGMWVGDVVSVEDLDEALGEFADAEWEGQP